MSSVVDESSDEQRRSLYRLLSWTLAHLGFAVGVAWLIVTLVSFATEKRLEFPMFGQYLRTQMIGFYGAPVVFVVCLLNLGADVITGRTKVPEVFFLGLSALPVGLLLFLLAGQR